jgi:predicted RNA methylase
MAAKKKNTAVDLPSQTDPRAPLDGALLLSKAQALLGELEADLLERARGSAAVREALRLRHEEERAKRRTADPLEVWERHLVTQVAASWVLSCVFVRTLEDRGLLGHNRIAGPGAADGQRLFFELAPSLTEREYLLTVFRELTRLPAAQDLFDARHNPVWLLGPSAELAKKLLAIFREPSIEVPGFRFGQPDSRFLGDLYQELSPEVRDRFDLLQTPDFVAGFILDKTIEEAISRFGLNELTVLDPTCGSGHFLLDAFERLYDRRLQIEPGQDAREAARRTLDAIYGADINPYAISIARFRLTLAFLEKGGYSRLGTAPGLSLHLATADSLLHSRLQRQADFSTHASQSSEVWKGIFFALEDEAAAREVFARKFAIVVGNPPFGEPPSRPIKDLYREMYTSASGKYVLAAPYVECFFSLARPGGTVGLIDSSTFANHKFGQPLIEEVLPNFHVKYVINTAGVYFPPPGFSVPTIILLGTNESPGDSVAILTQQAGLDPGEYRNPAEGLVWQSICDHYNEPGYADGYINVRSITRSELHTYPWPLAGGSGIAYVDKLEEICSKTLADVTDAAGLGAVAMSNADKLFIQPASVFERHGLLSWTKSHLTGEALRDYMYHGDERVFWPYDDNLEPRPLDLIAARWLAPHRANLEDRATFSGGTYKSDGRLWYGWHQLTSSRIRVARRVLIPEISTEPNAILDDATTSASQSLICFVPSEQIDAETTDAIVAFLNSSSMAVWLRKRCAPVSTARGDISKEKGRAERFRLPANMAKRVPLPDAVVGHGASQLTMRALAALGRSLRTLGLKREALWRQFETEILTSDSPDETLENTVAYDERLRLRAVVLQEELDWTIYGIVIQRELPLLTIETIADCYAAPDARPFLAPATEYDPEIAGSTPAAEAVRTAWQRRRQLLKSDPLLADVECWMFKRTWQGQRGVFGRHKKTGLDRALDKCEAVILRFAEQSSDLRGRGEPTTPHALLRKLGTSRVSKTLALLATRRGLSEEELIRRLLDSNSVRFVAALRYSATGMAKWERTRAQQSAEAFERHDFSDEQTARLRGEFDSPRERFISYAGCESADGGEPVYGWAGWNHLEQALVLAKLYMKRKDEGFTRERLTPMLAGLLELVPWVKLWHDEDDPDYGGRRGTYFETFLDGECHALGLTREGLCAWRPSEKRKTKKPRAHKIAAETEPAVTPQPERRGRKKAEPRSDSADATVAEGDPT